ncbi:MAG: FKBP-type peptidyl-prolyl cis-trans isomerase [Candidatus Nomurabacteria bacterium]|jgi:FKBP-type peptidyl-prolyl cis-trans isomerase|nr:FKBP-type peptidyl-prolyl cis-trans isomerase [Candidatus Nomurabacteria bacterium]
MESKTKTRTRIAIWIIALAMAIGTIMTYVIIIVAQNNPDSDPTQIAYQKYLENQQQKQQEQQELLDSYCPQSERDNPLANIDKYKSEPFAQASELKVETLQDGTGELTTAEQCIDVNYKGWNTKGEVFDSGAYAVIPNMGMVIQGWISGLVGMKQGGIYKLTIPAEQAYGEQGSGDKIPANESLTFVIEVVSVQ